MSNIYRESTKDTLVMLYIDLKPTAGNKKMNGHNFISGNHPDDRTYAGSVILVNSTFITKFRLCSENRFDKLLVLM